MISRSLLSGIIIIVLLGKVSNLAPPSFVGPWHHLYAKTDQDHEFTETHNMGQLPVYVDVQVQPRNGDNVDYTFPGVGSAQSSRFGVQKEIGGVVYMYNENKVVVKCPDGTNGVMQVIFTGEEWMPTYTQKEIEAWIRVRAWFPSDFPPPVFLSDWLPVSVNDATMTHLTVDTGIYESSLANYFVHVKVRVTDGGPLNGMVCDAQGSSLALTSSSQWGGVIYQARGTTFYIWAPRALATPTPGRGSLCNMADGWGSIMKGYGQEGQVRVEVYGVLGSENFGEVTTIAMGSKNERSILSGNVDMDNEIVTGKVYQVVNSQTYVWPAFGGVFFPQDQGHGYGGVVFSYSTSSLRIWYPNTSNGFYIDEYWGTEPGTTIHRDWAFVAKVHKVSTCWEPIDVIDGVYTVTGSAPYSYGTEVTYYCLNGAFHISGDLQRACSHYGWNGTLPVCGNLVNCSTPPDVRNGSVHFIPDHTLEGDTANITCNTGFNITGDSVITCQSNGTWSVAGFCNRIVNLVNCSTPPDVQNGSVHFIPDRALEGDTANITCNTGFNITGDSVITCQSNGSWSGAGYCYSIVNLLNCSTPPDIRNGSIHFIPDHTLEGGTANITCNTGFNITGDSVITCQSNGSWSAAGFCYSSVNLVNCSTPPDVQSGSVYFIPDHTLEGDTANITCNTGFNITGDSVITCQNNGTWSAAGICYAMGNLVNCSTPPDIQNGSVHFIPDHTLEGDTANITCNTGFNITGDSIITCQSNGTWSAAGYCNSSVNLVNCSTPPDVQNGSVQFIPDHTLEGDTANITCNTGFNITGESVITCQNNGTWSAAGICYTMGTSNLVNCPTPPDVQNGSVHFIPDHTLEGDTANITCNAGFNITGDSVITCQNNGAWSAAGFCYSIGQPTSCSSPPDIENGNIVYTSLYGISQLSIGGTASITCNTGYDVTGDSVITCLANGTWSPAPVCSSIGSTPCFCSCNTTPNLSSSPEYDNITLEETVRDIVNNLTVPTKTTSKYRRTLESAEDDRTSSVTIGCLGGLVVGVSVLAIVAVDIINVIEFLSLRYKKTEMI